MATSLREVSVEKIALFLFGVFFLIVMLAMAVAIPNPSPLQWRVFGLVLALIAAGIGAVVPGLIQIHVTPWIRGGGAAALFVLVYLFNPAVIVSVDPTKPLPPPPDGHKAKTVAERMVELANASKFGDLYDSMHPLYKETYPKERFLEASLAVRAPFGQAIKSTYSGEHASSSLANPRGHFRMITFFSEFQDGKQLVENAGLYANDTETWYPFGYTVVIK